MALNKRFILPEWAWWVASLTWGLPLSIFGLITALGLLIWGIKPTKFIYGWVFQLPWNFGGLNLGPITLVGTPGSINLRKHEFGHSIQNCIFGPTYFIFVFIPSVIRYWYRAIYNISTPVYDYAWYEGLATLFGTRYYIAYKETCE